MSLYFDNNATTAPDPAVVEAMLPYLRESFGNPSSLHPLGVEAADALARARTWTARLLGARSPREVTFTSGGTESIRTAIDSALATRPGRRRIVTSAVEHAAVNAPLERLERAGHEVVRVGVDGQGRLDVDAAVAAVDDRCALASFQWVNNETGVVTPRDVLRTLGEACRVHGAALHVDAMQAAGKVPLGVAELPLDLVSISAHKFHGPKGSGALWVRADAPFEPLFVGGPQELDRRAGTENVPAAVGLGKAAELALAHVSDPDGPAGVARLRDALEAGVLERVPGARVHGAGAPRVPSTASFSFEGIAGEALVMLLGELGLAASSGSACSSGKQGPSHVLLAMGIPERLALGALRLSLARTTTAAEVEAAVELVTSAVDALRRIAPTG